MEQKVCCTVCSVACIHHPPLPLHSGGTRNHLIGDHERECLANASVPKSLTCMTKTKICARKNQSGRGRRWDAESRDDLMGDKVTASRGPGEASTQSALVSTSGEWTQDRRIIGWGWQIHTVPRGAPGWPSRLPAAVVLTFHPGCIGRICNPPGEGTVLLMGWIFT